ncbi:hypothetical protein [Ferroacidibacillus organovorans]|uniref:DUF4190 domain-containing protein n=1 Tax=Ferroacidibacillus organovorans TaxID=1765683 RepID=A0A162UNB7_9BACL|nr:hypothetical protein [Ferroacidibacillus organovorans]KYP81899.1 hypothetical protein AYJ22_15785 [Ferroacidibacillus organovorans]OPG15866.1 hypothetical protein B2M26_09670 [Ferroacidibacillus organovorans]
MEPDQKASRDREVHSFLSFSFGILSILLLTLFFPVSLPFSIAGLVLGLMSRKRGQRKFAILGITFSAIALVACLLLIASFLALTPRAIS